ncbi:DUF4292 domain-containing protein [uncultured Muribaculum sp.]|uniref:DUF4292 domain-containing protein n=1 Tax=uncultured Muribaculum sp. TaxID=1918613 RepID=UPI00260691C6|nr:DUF4292 domain-containing protein [uncultured Muribaculum sp.]
MTRINKSLTCILIAMLAVMQACQPKKEIQGHIDGQTPTQQYYALTSPTAEWNSVEVPISFSLEKPQRISLSGRARIEQGKAIELSMRMIGIEVARLLIREDSLFAMYRLEKVYLAESVKSLTNRLPVSISNLQDMLIGRPFIIGASTMGPGNKKNVDLEYSLNSLTIIPQKQPKGMTYGFTANTGQEIYLSRFAALSDKKDITVTADYTPWTNTTPAGKVARTTLLDISAQKTKISAQISWKWQNAKWNTFNNISWQVPGNYRRINAEELLKNLHQ